MEIVEKILLQNGIPKEVIEKVKRELKYQEINILKKLLLQLSNNIKSMSDNVETIKETFFSSFN